MKETSPTEEFIFNFVDKFKPLFFPEKWKNSFLDYSKNEIFVLIYVYRKGSVNMSEIAEYIDVPLNTATGIIGRLEKKGVVIRQRDTEDKRVVTVSMTPEGMQVLRDELNSISFYYNHLMDSLSEEEKILLLKILSKLMDAVTMDLSERTKPGEKKIRKITIE